MGAARVIAIRKDWTRLVLLLLGLWTGSLHAIDAPRDLVHRAGDSSIVLHWERNREQGLAGYRVYRSACKDGPFTLLNPERPLALPSYCDAQATNGKRCFYRVTALDDKGLESDPGPTRGVVSKPFASDSAFLTYLQQTGFDYFWYAANPENGLVPDRSSPDSPCSVAAAGFGLTAIGIGVDHGWISRAQGRQRVLTTLNTFQGGPQHSGTSGAIGYKGWFYHFLDQQTARRFTRFRTEVSSIDTALLLAGVVYAREYFNGSHPQERRIRSLADAILERVDWSWMGTETNVLRMGWHPETGFIKSRWTGYSEAGLLYLLAIGANERPFPASAWSQWTGSFTWETNYGVAIVPFPPLFGHQYTQCWYDLREKADDCMRARGTTYFDNSRRAILSQRAYCMENPGKHTGYGGNVWGVTACDGPTGYRARGAPPPFNDDGTLAPTAVGGSIPFVPEYCIPTLRHLYREYRANLWTAYGFGDAFNLGANWWGTQVLGIDQGPIVIMIENHRTQKVWRTFMRNEQVKRGLRKAGFR